MEITSISFEKLFPTGAYANEKIRADVSLISGDNPMDAIDMARKIVNENFEKNNPHLVTPDIKVIPRPISKMQDTAMAELGKQVDKEKEKPQTLEEQINSCTEIKVLESYKFIVKGKPEEKVYNKKMKELSK